ncbi:MAG: hypothetical protein AB1697_11195 [Pseudomonadota bacterium]
MKKLITALVAMVAMSITAHVKAGNVAPLGLELGVATLDQVKAMVGSQTPLTDKGINAYSDGPMLAGDGRGLNIEGLENILFIFTPSNRLEGVVMTMSKHKFDEVLGFMSRKYRVQKRVIPYVGDKYVRFTSGNSIAEINAPHLSFSMEVVYITNTLDKAFKTRSAAAEQQRRQEQGSKF